jgi:hypothetical protein
MLENIHANPVAMRVQNGTLRSDVDLCSTCRWAIRRQASASGWSEVRCDAAAGRVVPEPVATCNRYLDAHRLSLGEMVQIAWVVEAKGKTIGFLSPEEVAKRRDYFDVPAQSPVGF